MIEKWVDIEGYEGIYKISNLGNVYSYKSGIILKHRLNTKGYVHYGLRKDGVAKDVRAHRLVATYFIPNPDNLPLVNHIDGDKTNNAYTNLEWCTHSYNQKHAYATGLRVPNKGKRCKIF